MQNNSWIWWLVAAVVVIGGLIWWWQSPAQQAADTGASSPAAQTETGATSNDQGTGLGVDVGASTNVSAGASAPMFTVVTYDGASFSPPSVTIKKGGTVTWNNEGTSEMWVASAQHPNHTIYSGTSRVAHCPDTSKTAFDQCQGGNNYTFKFDKIGTWNYHDHLNVAAFGSVTVVE